VPGYWSELQRLTLAHRHFPPPSVPFYLTSCERILVSDPTEADQAGCTRQSSPAYDVYAPQEKE